SRSRHMTRREGVILRAEIHAVPDFLRSYRRPSATSSDVDSATDHARDHESKHHRQEDAHPLLAAAPPANSSEHKSRVIMSWPIPNEAHPARNVFHGAILMLRDEIADLVIKAKRRHNDYRRNRDSDDPVEKRAVFHKIGSRHICRTLLWRCM